MWVTYERKTGQAVHRVSILGIYNEVEGAFGRWKDEMLHRIPVVHDQVTSAQIIEESNLDYTLLRLPWVYNEEGNEKYAYTKKVNHLSVFR